MKILLAPSIRLLSLLVLPVLGSASFPAQAGNGRVNPDGTIDFTIYLRYPPTPANVAKVKESATAASQVLWDATEGQMRFGQVNITCGRVDEDLADVWVFPNSGRAMSALNGFGVRGAHVTLFQEDLDLTFPHEMGHMALGLGDEYGETHRFGNCWGIGPCMEPGTMSERNQCLMQQPGGFSNTEFCTRAAHDLIRGDGLSCEEAPVPHGCLEHCELFNHETGHYETSRQTMVNGKSCWETLVEKFGLDAPIDLPMAEPPPKFAAPTFVETCDAADTVMLVLDRSESMSWHPDRDNGEVCGDGIDNDGDGHVDESPCLQPRLQFVKAAARAWLALANDEGVRAGIIRFNHTANSIAPIQEITADSLDGLTGAVDNELEAAGRTAIGTALEAAMAQFDADPAGAGAAAAKRGVLLISDGVNTDGPDPQAAIGSLQARGIRLFTVATGGASDQDNLSRLSEATSGLHVASPSARTLVNAFAQQWANRRNLGVLIPSKPFQSNQTNTFRVEPGTRKVSLMLAGDLADMTGFGLRSVLEGPAGPGLAHFDTAVAHPAMRVVNDGFFQLVELHSPNPGLWRLRSMAAPGAAPAQNGNLTVLIDHPQTALFASVRPTVAPGPNTPVTLRVVPVFHTPLLQVDQLFATLIHPDGRSQRIELTPSVGGEAGQFEVSLGPLPLAGRYEVLVTMDTGLRTVNDPGEPIWSNAPPAAVAVPMLTRQAVVTFFVRGAGQAVLNDNPRDAAKLQLGASGATSVSDAIDASNPADYFQFDAPAGARLWATVDTGGAAFPPPTTRNSVLTLLAANGTTILEEDNDDGTGNGGDATVEPGGLNASAIAGRLLPASGSYYLRVRAFGNNDAYMPYKLYVNVTTNAPTPEVENNNTLGAANPILTAGASLGLRSGTLSSTNDVDLYSVVGSAGSLLHISADTDSARNAVGPDVVMDILSSSGLVLFTANSSGSSGLGKPAAEGFVWRLTDSGTNYVRVRGFNGATGSYHLMVARKASVRSAPLLTRIVRVGGQFLLTFPTAIGKSYQVQSCAGHGAAWSSFPDTLPGTGAEAQFMVTPTVSCKLLRVMETDAGPTVVP